MAAGESVSISHITRRTGGRILAEPGNWARTWATATVGNCWPVRFLPLNAPGALIAEYIFTDATGAQYHLNQNSGGVWTSQESIHVSYDSNTGKLHFNDGSFWVMGAARPAPNGMPAPCTQRRWKTAMATKSSSITRQASESPGPIPVRASAPSKTCGATALPIIPSPTTPIRSRILLESPITLAPRRTTASRTAKIMPWTRLSMDRVSAPLRCLHRPRSPAYRSPRTSPTTPQARRTVAAAQAPAPPVPASSPGHHSVLWPFAMDLHDREHTLWFPYV